jgi:hypothetical protein
MPAIGSERKKAKFKEGKKWTLHHKNAPAHSFHSNYLWLAHKAQHTCPTTSVLTKSQTNRFLLVPNVEIRTESNIESDDIKENSQTMLCAFPQKAFQQCSQSRVNTGSRVFGVQGTTLKETRPNNSYINETRFQLKVQEFLGQHTFITGKWPLLSMQF